MSDNKVVLSILGAVLSAIALFIWQAPGRLSVVEMKVGYIENTIKNVTEKVDEVLANQRRHARPEQ